MLRRGFLNWILTLPVFGFLLGKAESEEKRSLLTEFAEANLAPGERVTIERAPDGSVWASCKNPATVKPWLEDDATEERAKQQEEGWLINHFGKRLEPGERLILEFSRTADGKEHRVRKNGELISIMRRA